VNAEKNQAVFSAFLPLKDALFWSIFCFLHSEMVAMILCENSTFGSFSLDSFIREAMLKLVFYFCSFSEKKFISEILLTS